MTLMDLVRKIGQEPDCNFLRGDIKQVVLTYHKVLARELAKGQRWVIPNLGIFQSRVKSERNAYNPFTKEKITIPRCVYPIFKFQRDFKLKMRATLSPDAGFKMTARDKMKARALGSALRAKRTINEDTEKNT